jgi:hypothetical protein
VHIESKIVARRRQAAEKGTYVIYAKLVKDCCKRIGQSGHTRTKYMAKFLASMTTPVRLTVANHFTDMRASQIREALMGSESWCALMQVGKVSLSLLDSETEDEPVFARKRWLVAVISQQTISKQTEGEFKKQVHC